MLGCTLQYNREHQYRLPVKGILVLYFLSFGLLDGDTINGHCQLCLRGFGALSLLDLLTELQLPDSLLHNVDTLRLVYFC